TEDDRTRDAIAAFAGVDLVEHEGLAEAVASFLRARGRPRAPGALRQALLPRGAAPLLNPLGTASGFFLDARGTRLVALPGPPSELRATAGEDLRGLASALPGEGEAPLLLRLDTFGLAEAELDPLLDAVRSRGDVSVGTLAAGGTIGVVLASRGPSAQAALDEARSTLEETLGDRVYGEGGATMAEVLVHSLAERGMTAALAESCTGGLMAHWLTEVPGASEVFKAGVVAYANEAKERDLGVPGELLRRTGAVDGEVAAAMARGIATRAGCDLGVGITGIAGPGGGSEEKPVGLVFVAVSLRGRTEVRRLHWAGLGRSWVKRLAALSALDLARRMVAAPAEGRIR
ncbi:MAG: nicotinamide-nucleotide amidohydrolase family protein, partial [Planctomycetota bacterium]